MYGAKALIKFGLLAACGMALLSAAQSASAQESRQSKSIYLPIVSSNNGPNPADDWLASINFYRASANVPAVTENQAWSAGIVQHAMYIVKNDLMLHDEMANNPLYTSAGREAAQKSDLFSSASLETTSREVIDAWMRSPFHASGVIDPRIQQVGFGSYREAGSGYQMAAGLNILSDLGAHYFTPAAYPVLWPADGKTVPLASYDGSEYPDPLASCPGYASPTGLPVLMLLGNSRTPPQVTASAFRQGAQALDHCIFDEKTYTNPDNIAQGLARQVLHMRGAVVLIPRAPLVNGSTYTVSIDVNGINYTWSFQVGDGS